MAAPPDASSTMRAWQMASPGHVPSQLRLRTDVRRPQAKDLGRTDILSIVPYLVHDSSSSSSSNGGGGVPAQGGDVAGGGGGGGDVGGEAAAANTTTVFINSGSGGTGTYMIQIAKLLGCHVTVSCSTAKAPLCRSLGADAIIDYKTSDVVAELARRGRHVFDLVIDNVGYSPANLYAECTRARVMKPAAVFVVVTGNPLAIVSWLRPAFLGGGTNKMVMYLTRARRPDLDQLTRWLDDGKLRSVVDRTFAFEDAREAFAYLMQGSAAGKVVVRVAADLE
ncbi:Alcohol dehydrogenase superfamily, zinc-type [Moelleriella libera RCEF 2490]|uniref:Alcohol dehydrogenase superfamily, zinc-type n=1 Tax=Moelleriella libera RCEF 2490 TaxID=1081109 RepID=A0A167Y501_9HYPO|nr:Alcohol dehydrogenase superfamily, zinc-type [Moelleriella libera RCEF 2490]